MWIQTAISVDVDLPRDEGVSRTDLRNPALEIATVVGAEEGDVGGA